MTRSQGRGGGQWREETELYLTSSLILLYKEALSQCPRPGSAVLVTAIIILDPSDSAALISGIASLAPLTLRDRTTFSSPCSFPLLGPCDQARC